MPPTFNQVAFFRAIERRLGQEKISRRELARRLGLSPSTFTRLAQGKHPDVETFLRILDWLVVPAETFLDGASAKGPADAISLISAALRGDPAIDSEDAAAIEDIVKAAYYRFRTR